MNSGELLVEAGTLTPEQLAEAREAHAKHASPLDFVEFLIESGRVTTATALPAIGRPFHLPVLLTIEASMLDTALIENIPVDWARQHLVFPIRHEGGLAAVMASPESLPRLEELALLLHEELVGLLAPASEIRRVIDQAYFERKREAPVAGGPAGEAVGRDAPVRSDDLLRAYDEAPVTQLVNGIILDAVRCKASDVHVEPFESHLRIRFRIDGFLYEQPAPPKQLEQAFISRLKVMSRLDITERRLPQDGMAKVRAGEREIDIRVSTVPVAEGERVVLRLLNQSATLMPLAELGMPPVLMGRFREAMALPNGILLVTGPTGSGKTTTLYAALREMDTLHRNIMTIEDPIEYQMANIGQIQVKPKIGLTFASGLRHILRQDPDVILVGEIRDQETAEIAVRAALTGHLVFSTLHTNDAASAIVRLADMGVQPYLISSSVRAILAQRLVRRLCPVCREPVHFDDAMLVGLEPVLADRLRGKNGFQASGCATCMQGYRGRVGLYELLVVGAAEQELIRSGASTTALRLRTTAQGATLGLDAVSKVLEGLTSLDELRRVIEAGGLGTAT